MRREKGTKKGTLKQGRRAKGDFSSVLRTFSVPTSVCWAWLWKVLKGGSTLVHDLSLGGLSIPSPMLGIPVSLLHSPNPMCISMSQGKHARRCLKPLCSSPALCPLPLPLKAAQIHTMTLSPTQSLCHPPLLFLPRAALLTLPRTSHLVTSNGGTQAPPHPIAMQRPTPKPGSRKSPPWASPCPAPTQPLNQLYPFTNPRAP